MVISAVSKKRAAVCGTSITKTCSSACSWRNIKATSATGAAAKNFPRQHLSIDSLSLPCEAERFKPQWQCDYKTAAAAVHTQQIRKAATLFVSRQIFCFCFFILLQKGIQAPPLSHETWLMETAANPSAHTVMHTPAAVPPPPPQMRARRAISAPVLGRAVMLLLKA